ncbi:hypothetical protein Taro_028400 [Colocasia esculenta]|uniref:Uncharacterized protein n=1 Tax=Colocasia esculenta TaxID=4460 RepID=A0A843VB52_COLES|nr:hypothetical protein [Colocasia esculenta]
MQIRQRWIRKVPECCAMWLGGVQNPCAARVELEAEQRWRSRWSRAGYPSAKAMEKAGRGARQEARAHIKGPQDFAGEGRLTSQSEGGRRVGELGELDFLEEVRILTCARNSGKRKMHSQLCRAFTCLD